MKAFKCWISLCKSSPVLKELLKSIHFRCNNLSIPDLHFSISEEWKRSVKNFPPVLSTSQMHSILFSLNKTALQNTSWPGTLGLLCKTQNWRIMEDLGRSAPQIRRKICYWRDFCCDHFLLLLGFSQVLFSSYFEIICGFVAKKATLNQRAVL